ncbi:chemotaxis protein CheB [Sulfuricurvum sp.]|uniref:chemotaxis protein CheB n=1 Tax=Sulfuricurvum sp. TaxID=2025608 RepID=UPI003C35B880
MTRKKTTKTPATQVPHINFPIVGIGASAGGLAAFEAFFSSMPSEGNPDIAFVLVQHLAPEHTSLLADLIQKYTKMEVFEVKDGVVVRPNCVYIIPPGFDMALLNGTLQLLEPTKSHGHRMAIDFFFSSLAQDQREHSIGIILTGTGSDGTQGLRAIKSEGGMVMVQEPTSAEYDGMPRSAVATGLVDYELPLSEMPSQLMNYVTHLLGNPNSSVLPEQEKERESALKKIFILLRTHTGHDFSQYKPSTIYRRVERRMVVHKIETIHKYVQFLQQKPVEIEELFRDLLIGVTKFFRDPETFAILKERIIPKLFEDKPAGSTIRVWSSGCSSGEEAYSIAILLYEYLEESKQHYTVQVFATDIDAHAIAIARAGVYPLSIATSVSKQRLKQFFTLEPDGSTYRIHKSIRDLLIFSEHDLIKDPPFSKLDLISCRNLMIYMSAELQKKIIPMFHYALNPNGILFLGSSESIGESSDLFSTLDLKSKLYMRNDHITGNKYKNSNTYLLPVKEIHSTFPERAMKSLSPKKLPLRELTEQALLQQLAPFAALINEMGDILYLHGRSGAYLELPSGESSTNNILLMAREGLRRDLTIALHNAIATKEIVRSLGLKIKMNAHFIIVNLTIRPVATGLNTLEDAYLYLVILEEASLLDSEQAKQGVLRAFAESDTPDANAHLYIAALKQELLSKEEYINIAKEKMESANEKLKSSNEQMQSVNEELQSANEELETSKEELQSTNEELSTVNAELQTKVADLSQANNDMNNLLAGTGVGTVFVDHQLRILRFTSEARKIINLIPGDEGRPVAHLVSNLVGYTHMVSDVQSVLNTLVPKEVDVQTTSGRWYAMRIFPYRTLDNVIEGAVLTFMDITEIAQTREELVRANEALRLAVVVRDANDAITVQDLNGRILAWNPGAVRMYGWSEAEALAMNTGDRIPQELREEALHKVHQLSLSEILEPYHTQRITKSGEVIEIWLTATALVNEFGKVYAIATTERTKKSVNDSKMGEGNVQTT